MSYLGIYDAIIIEQKPDARYEILVPTVSKYTLSSLAVGLSTTGGSTGISSHTFSASDQVLVMFPNGSVLYPVIIGAKAMGVVKPTLGAPPERSIVQKNGQASVELTPENTLVRFNNSLLELLDKSATLTVDNNSLEYDGQKLVVNQGVGQAVTYTELSLVLNNLVVALNAINTAAIYLDPSVKAVVQTILTQVQTDISKIASDKLYL